MAKRIGTQGLTASQKQRRAALAGSAATIILFILPVPLVVKAVFALLAGKIFTAAWTLGVFAIMIFAARMIQKGKTAEINWRMKKIAKMPRAPNKIMGSIILGAITFFAAWFLAKEGLFQSIGFGAAAGAGSLMLYGLDPLHSKGLDGADAAKVVEALDGARAQLERIETAGTKLSSYQDRQRVKSVVANAEAVLQEIEEDPRDLRRARKFLNVYMTGAVDVTERYAAAEAKGRGDELKDNFSKLLTDMEHVFKEQHDKLLQDDVLDLDVQMDVLRTRLTKEGVL